VFAEGGRAAATATGDLLLSRAFAELVATGSEDAVRALSAASSALARGELMQRADAWSDDVTPERYLERCRLKTATLFECACLLGRDVPELGAFGAEIGLAFQLLDDVLDVSGPPERTGKARGTDLRDGTVTLPLIVAAKSDPTLREADLRDLDGAAAGSLCDRIAATGALDTVRTRAIKMVADAKKHLSASSFDAEQKRLLELVADGVVQRYA
jgi:geranylgeranyl pyrophosphate synthase